MGGAQSREAEKSRLTLERESFDVVHVSEDVVKRLRGGQKSAEATSEEKTPSSYAFPSLEPSEQSLHPSRFDISSEQLRSLLEEEKTLTSRLSKDLGNSQRELESVKNKVDQLEAELRSQSKSRSKFDQESLYQKLKELNQRQLELQETMKKRFQEAVDEVSKKFFSQQTETACSSLESQVLKCYMDNPMSSLNCNSLAADFIKCVKEYRADMLARQA